MDRPNYFLLLELPDLDKDANNVPAILARIATKQNEWSKGRNHPTKGKQYQLWLGLLPKMKELMQDDAKRQEEAAEAKKTLAQQQAKSLGDFDEQAGIAASKGYLTEADVTAFSSRFKMSVADVRARIQKLGFSVQKEVAKQTISRPRLDGAVEARILSNLKIIGKADLYDFLGMPRSASVKTLLAKANEVYTDVRKIATKDASTGAQQDLAGDCMKVFASEKEREKYNGSLAWGELDRIRNLAEAAGVGAGRIVAGTMDLLLSIGKKEQLDTNEVIDAVREVAKQRGWPLEVPAEPASKSMQRCGTCGELAAPHVANCPKDGTPFKLACPKCGTINPSESSFCAKQGCGFAIGEMFLGQRNYRDADMEWSKGNITEAKRLLAVALTYWPGHKEASRLVAEVQKRTEDEQKAIQAVETALTKKELRSAQQAVAALRKLVPQQPRLKDFEAKIAAGLAEAEKHLLRARQALKDGKLDDAIDAFGEALRANSEAQEAKDGLSRCPPEAPARLNAALSPRAVALSWPASTSRGQLRYRVIRKARSEPTVAGDGDLVGETAGLSLTDPNAGTGVPFYYAVYTERGGVCSLRAASAGPLVRIAEVTGLRPMAGDKSVSLEWQLPTGARALEVWRQLGAVPRRGEGTRLQGVSLRSVRDTGLTNGTTYGYRVIVLFDGADGRPLPSEGETCLVTPLEPPKPVTDLKVARRGSHFEATWNAPRAGEVRLYALRAAPLQRPGELLPAAEVDALGRRLAATGPTSARDAIPGDAVIHLLPVTVLGAAAVIGRAVAVSWIDDVEELSAQVRDGFLRATWQWPDKIEMAHVLWRTDEFPSGPDDPKATRIEWPRQRYQIEGGMRQPAPDAQRIYLTVYAAVSRGDERWDFSPGEARCEVAIQSHRTVHYKISKPSWFSGRSGEYHLTLKPDGPMTLPDLVLVAKSNGIPLRPADGNVLLCLIAGHECAPNRPLHKTFNPPPDFASCKVRLFPVNDDDCRWLTVIDDT